MVKKNIVSELTSKEFNDLRKKSRLMVVDFYAEWCMPCLMMAPILERVAQKHSEINFAKVNVDESQDLAQEFEVSSIPCIVFFQDGEEVDRSLGQISEDLLEEKVRDYLKGLS